MIEKIKSFVRGLIVNHKTYKGIGLMFAYWAATYYKVLPESEWVWATLVSYTGVGMRAAVGRVSSNLIATIDAIRFLAGILMSDQSTNSVPVNKPNDTENQV